MIPDEAERVIRCAAEAERAYFLMLDAAAENARYRLELIDRRVTVDAELRGERISLPLVPDMSLTLEDAVSRELEAMRSIVRVTVQRRRARKVDMGCHPPRIEVSAVTQARARLKKIWLASCLSITELAAAWGMSSATIDQDLRGGKIAPGRRAWYLSLQSVRVDDDRVTIVVKRPAPTRKNAAFYWRRGLVPKYKLK